MEFGIKGIGAIKTYNQILIITKSTQLVLSIILLIFGLGLIGVSIAYFASVIVNRILQSIAYYNYSNETKQTKRKLKIKFDKIILKIYCLIH